MARIHYWQFLINEEGQPIPNAEIYFYESESSTPAYFYTQDGGGTATRSYPGATTPDEIITTDDNGFFEFWVADSSEVNGYNSDQEFRLEWYKAGITNGYIDFLNIFPAIFEVDETDTTVTKNKTISNFLANKWNNHVDETYSSDSHGIEPLSVGDVDTTLNKLISNYYGNRWENHVADNYASAPHSIGQVDETDTNATLNKLVSNNLAKGWEDKADVYNVAVTSWQSSAGQYYVDINHMIGNQYPLVQVYSTASGRQYWHTGYYTDSLDSNRIRIWMSTQPNINVVIVG